MIVTSVIVLAIVGSAVAFKTKVKPWCANTDGSNNCTMITGPKRIVPAPFGQAFKYYPDWDGDGSKCHFANNGLCTATFNLIDD